MLPRSVKTEQEVLGFMVTVWNCICGIALDKRGTTAENRMSLVQEQTNDG